VVAVPVDDDGLDGAHDLIDALAPLYTTLDGIRPGQRFRPTDPTEVAHAQAGLSGLTAAANEDADGMEASEQFGSARTIPTVTAIDAGVVRLGNTEDGMIAAVRGAAITYRADGGVTLKTVRPGLVYVCRDNRLELFHRMGEAFNRPGFFVHLDDDDVPTELKVELGPHDHRTIDRLRNLVERKLQEYVISTAPPGVVLIDGALTLRTFDTPGPYMKRLAETAEERGISLVAVAKKTGLAVNGVDITMLLGDGARPNRRKITRAVRQQQAGERFLGDLYVARFSPGGDTYRVDVAPAAGRFSAHVFDEMYAACRFRNGYPEPLLTAHIHSYMTPPVVAQLQAHAVAAHGLVVKPDINLGPIFAPFGGRYK
jgi:hypothetical protein